MKIKNLFKIYFYIIYNLNKFINLKYKINHLYEKIIFIKFQNILT